jgi:hypothetical protein
MFQTAFDPAEIVLKLFERSGLLSHGEPVQLAQRQQMGPRSSGRVGRVVSQRAIDESGSGGTVTIRFGMDGISVRASSRPTAMMVIRQGFRNHVDIEALEHPEMKIPISQHRVFFAERADRVERGSPEDKGNGREPVLNGQIDE